MFEPGDLVVESTFSRSLIYITKWVDGYVYGVFVSGLHTQIEFPFKPEYLKLITSILRENNEI